MKDKLIKAEEEGKMMEVERKMKEGREMRRLEREEKKRQDDERARLEKRKEEDSNVDFNLRRCREGNDAFMACNWRR